MANKPLYGKFITSADFNTKDDAERWAKSQKEIYRGSESIKFDIARTPASGWKVTLFAKI